MASLPEPVPHVEDYMSYFTAAKNDPFSGNYLATLAPYVIEVAAPTDALVLAGVSRKFYILNGNAPTAFLLWLSTQGFESRVDPSHIFLLHSVSKFLIRLGRPATKWDSKAFAYTRCMVAGSIALSNWDPSYLNFLWNLENVPSPSKIYTALDATPPPPSSWNLW